MLSEELGTLGTYVREDGTPKWPIFWREDYVNMYTGAHYGEEDARTAVGLVKTSFDEGGAPLRAPSRTSRSCRPWAWSTVGGRSGCGP